jgi:hypothetical protein
MLDASRVYATSANSLGWTLRDAGLLYVDVGELGFESALREARHHLLAPLLHRSIDPRRCSLHPRPQ